ncbi:glycosyltransferase family 1 protein [Alteraurantiacibacter aestuarii]|uniref:Glycosyltransferase n=1 Tax=Alteraurantiacibacter aestuarii TaxID=650004 RepID=A0A844ZJJ2_9SPHN|nr:glycosyltransferase family 1 protein [Alteraurantiacibacter aestuarii]MXO88631.1 glycosyltransferase [Alteraurantiacibacter aestuarii]
MKIAIVTDAWAPQINGVVNATRNVWQQLTAQGHAVLLVTPDQFRSVPCPTYPEIRLAMTRPSDVGEKIARFDPDAIHLMTEGPLCLAARSWCLRRKRPFTTAFCTNFPTYLALRTGISSKVFWPYFRWFHGPAQFTFGSTPSIRQSLADEGISPVRTWGRGVDLDNFRPEVLPPDIFFSLPRPIILYAGRIAVEKNVEAFLTARHAGSKVLVGDGPARAALQARFPQAHFLGFKQGADLAGVYAGADALVFPSLTDTFGVVMIEALACGTPVAAFPVAGPMDVLTPTVGAMDHDLDRAIERALLCDRDACAAYGKTFTWGESAREFLDGMKMAC